MSNDEEKSVFWLLIEELLIFPKFFFFILPWIAFIINPFISNDYHGFLTNTIKSPMPDEHRFIADFMALYFLILVFFSFFKLFFIGYSKNNLKALEERVSLREKIGNGEIFIATCIFVLVLWYLFILSEFPDRQLSLFNTLHLSEFTYFLSGMAINIIGFVFFAFLIFWFLTRD